MHTTTRKNARELTLRLLKAKADTHPELLETRDYKGVTQGIGKAFEARSIRVDEEAAEGIAEAIQEFLPSARDEVEGSSLLWTPRKRGRVWRPS